MRGCKKTASEFGNYIAGYSSAYNFGYTGYLLTRLFGIGYNAFESNPNFDADSIDDIQDGAAHGQYESDNPN